MRVQIKSRGIQLTDQLRQFTERRLLFALGRFAGRVLQVQVNLCDANGPRGGVDQCCGIQVSWMGGRKVLVEERTEDIHASVARAAERAGRTVARRYAAAALHSR